ncbi:MAG: glycosyltransferase [Pseudomonadota bacterium]
MRVMIVVTHLLGTGHLARALTLARAFDSAGWQCSIVSGGMPAPHLDRGDLSLTQLPPVRSDGVNFARLLDGPGRPVEPEYMAQRESFLVAALTRYRPDVLITELFPFGRRVLGQEFTTLLETAKSTRPAPLICASIRDILAPPSKPQKAARTDQLIDTFYDAVLVHADASVTPLELSWPVSDRLRPKLHYTGFVAPPAAPPHAQALGAGGVLVSAGGGDVGRALFETALEAAVHSAHPWRVLVGGQNAAAQVAALVARAPTNVTVEPARPDFRSLLHHAAASVSMCGYNTALDLLQSGCPAVLVPFDAGAEVEQSLRAQALAQQPGFDVIKSAALNPSKLNAALARVIEAPRRPPAQEGLNGAAQTVELVARLLESRR